MCPSRPEARETSFRRAASDAPVSAVESPEASRTSIIPSPGRMRRDRVTPIAIATAAFASTIIRNRPTSRPFHSATITACTMPKKTRGTANALSSSMRIRPASPRGPVVFPSQGPARAPTSAAPRICSGKASFIGAQR